jgi:hypothetical protein
VQSPKSSTNITTFIGEERYDMLTHYLGTYLRQTCSAPIGSKTMDALRMKNNTWMELCEVFHLYLNNSWSAHLLNAFMDEWRWNPYLLKNSCMFFKGPSQTHPSTWQMNMDFTTFNMSAAFLQAPYEVSYDRLLSTHCKGGAQTCGVLGH